VRLLAGVPGNPCDAVERRWAMNLRVVPARFNAANKAARQMTGIDEYAVLESETGEIIRRINRVPKECAGEKFNGFIFLKPTDMRLLGVGPGDEVRVRISPLEMEIPE
jgi:hypothetical protein